MRSLSKASRTSCALRAWRMDRRWSVKTFLNVENEFSHMAVDAPNVSPSLIAVTTLGMASSVLWYVERSFCVVHLSFGCFSVCVRINCFATTHSVSLMVDLVNVMMCWSKWGSKNVPFSGFKAASERASCVLRSLKR